MGPLIGVLAIAAFVALSVGQHRARRNNPFRDAFSTTFVALLLVVPGLLGYELHKSDWSIIRITHGGSPVWWQVYIGLMFVLPAIYFWRKVVRELR
jgi:hypothetical protein